MKKHQRLATLLAAISVPVFVAFFFVGKDYEDAVFIVAALFASAAFGVWFGSSLKRREVIVDGEKYQVWTWHPERGREYIIKSTPGRRIRVFAEEGGVRAVLEKHAAIEYADWWEAVGEIRPATPTERRIFDQVFQAC